MVRKILEFYFKCYYRLQLDLSAVDIGLYKKKFYKELPHNFMFKLLDKSDMKYIEKMNIKESYRQILINRFNNAENHKCFAILDTGKQQLAYYCWANSLKKYYHNEFESYHIHKGDVVLFENDFAAPQYRKMGFHSYCMLQRIIDAEQSGFKKAIINIYFKNEPALKAAQKFGFKKTWHFPVSLRKGTWSYTIGKIINKRKT